jgi:RNA polymerase sigma-70 factor (ECF subfamily)
MSKEEKFRQLTEENSNRIWSVCRYYSKDRECQKDIYQEVLINIWKGLDSFRGDALPGTWIYRIAVNTAIGFTMKEHKRLRMSVSLEGKSLNTILETPDECDFREKESVLENLENQINQLSVIEKILISLQLEDLSSRDIAEIVGITEPNVRVKIHRIKSELREKMNSVNNLNFSNNENYNNKIVQ